MNMALHGGDRRTTSTLHNPAWHNVHMTDHGRIHKRDYAGPTPKQFYQKSVCPGPLLSDSLAKTSHVFQENEVKGKGPSLI